MLLIFHNTSFALYYKFFLDESKFQLLRKITESFTGMTQACLGSLANNNVSNNSMEDVMKASDDPLEDTEINASLEYFMPGNTIVIL